MISAVSNIVEDDARREIVHYGWKWPYRALVGLVGLTGLRDRLLRCLIRFDRPWNVKVAEANAIWQSLGSPALHSHVRVDESLVRRVSPVAHQGVRVILQKRGLDVRGDGIHYSTDWMSCHPSVQLGMGRELVRAVGCTPLYSVA
jgi:hypothetical protein